MKIETLHSVDKRLVNGLDLWVTRVSLLGVEEVGVMLVMAMSQTLKTWWVGNWK